MRSNKSGTPTPSGSGKALERGRRANRAGDDVTSQQLWKARTLWQERLDVDDCLQAELAAMVADGVALDEIVDGVGLSLKTLSNLLMGQAS
jgi:hypothetical protein